MVTYGSDPTVNAGDIMPVGQTYPGTSAQLVVSTGNGGVAQPPGVFMAIGVTEIYEGGGNNFWSIYAIRIA